MPDFMPLKVPVAMIVPESSVTNDPRATVLQALRGRRSIRRYEKTPVSDELVSEILAAAVSAPSAHNRQPWRFAHVADQAMKERLATAMADRLRADRAGDGDASATIEADAARSIARITGAPVCLILSLSMEDMDRYPDARRANAEYIMAVQGCAMALQNLLVAAHAFGLGSSVMCAPLFCQDAVVEVLGLPKPWQPQALVTMGYPASPPKPFNRHKLSDVVRVVRAQS
jgi:coenzyme F420-0:L-glutamate ligase / coenzyme F420-1:gamma-L-glutamate ligase